MHRRRVGGAVGYLLSAAVVMAVTVLSVSAVPHVISYQGRVSNDGVLFDGTGYFKFALLDPVGGAAYWSNDGTTVFDEQPISYLQMPVQRGRFTVLLGDTNMPGMLPLPVSAFTNELLSLRVWFSDGLQDFVKVEPDVRIGAVAYALAAEFSHKVAEGAITTAMIADGAVTTAKLAPGATVSNLMASGQAGVASGGILLSPSNSPALVAAGYGQIGTVSIGDRWVQRSGTGSPAARNGHAAVWTGTRMLVWGGTGNSGRLGDGGAYNPSLNEWAALPDSGAPSARDGHTAIWTGTRMIVWGGQGTLGRLRDGAAFNPSTGVWTSITIAGAPSARSGHTAIWTGTEMIVWGGTGDAGRLSDGARYNPDTDTWTALPASGIAVRQGHSAVWTGTEMIIWGGLGNSGALNDGRRYNVAGNTWLAVAAAGAPAAREGHVAAWTGTGMMIWGGAGSGGAPLGDGGLYSPGVNTWVVTAAAGAPAARSQAATVWTGTEVLVWGGVGATSRLGDGGRYIAAANGWGALPESGPSARSGHSAVWSGGEMIVFGGVMDDGTRLSDTHAYTANREMLLYLKP